MDAKTADSVASFQVDHMIKNTVDFDMLVTTCSTCKNQLEKAAKDKNIEVLHLSELVAQMIQKD